MHRISAILVLSTAAAMLLSSSAMAADLMMSKAATGAPVAAGGNWDGAYVGVNAGYGWGSADYDGTTTANLTGLFVGGQVGYNFHLTDGVVAGVEAGIDWNNEQGQYPTTSTSRINWDASVLARVGIDAGQFLPYAEAGVAFANESENYGGSPYVNNFTGWAAGAGVEFKLTDNVSTNLEYRYSDFGSHTIDGPNTMHLTDQTIRLGINYHM